VAPDNLAVDAWGAVYVIEDGEPNGGDVWKCHDADRNGVAESMGVLLSLGITGSEPTGMVFDPVRPYRFLINVQHPASGNDATWAFDTRPYRGSELDVPLRTGVDAVPTASPGEFVKSAFPLDVVTLVVDSPGQTLYGAPFAILLQAFPTSTGTFQFLPPLWMHPAFPIVPLVGGPVGQFTTVLPYGGGSIAVQVPAGLAGLSVMAQAIAVAPVGSLAVTDGHEVVLR
jgi:hypothetical protein